MEIWKDIMGYKGLYQVSNLARVRSLDRLVPNGKGMAMKKGKIIALSCSKTKYLKAHLWKDNKQYSYLVHRLVAQHFIENPNSLPEVNHKDENVQNNNLTNLEWCDRLYNANYGTAIKRRAEKAKGVSIGEKPILQFDKTGKLVARHRSAIKAANSINGCNSAICKCANGKYKTSQGFIWRWEHAQESKAV